MKKYIIYITISILLLLLIFSIIFLLRENKQKNILSTEKNKVVNKSNNTIPYSNAGDIE